MGHCRGADFCWEFPLDRFWGLQRLPHAIDRRTDHPAIDPDVSGNDSAGDENRWALSSCTPIVDGDMVDMILDRQRYPQFRGERSQTLITMPTNRAAWERYFEICAQCILLEPVDLTAANGHYLEHRAELNAGA